MLPRSVRGRGLGKGGRSPIVPLGLLIIFSMAMVKYFVWDPSSSSHHSTASVKENSHRMPKDGAALIWTNSPDEETPDHFHQSTGHLGSSEEKRQTLVVGDSALDKETQLKQKEMDHSPVPKLNSEALASGEHQSTMLSALCQPSCGVEDYEQVFERNLDMSQVKEDRGDLTSIDFNHAKSLLYEESSSMGSSSTASTAWKPKPDLDLQLFVIWAGAFQDRKKILLDVASKFIILHVELKHWGLDFHSSVVKKKSSTPAFSKQELDQRTLYFRENLWRLYTGKGDWQHKGMDLKVKQCGKGPFIAMVVADPHPTYAEETTAHGLDVVNHNMNTAKKKYRSWSGGGFKVHGTFGPSEATHDILMIFGKEKEDFVPRTTDGVENLKRVAPKFLHKLNHYLEQLKAGSVREFESAPVFGGVPALSMYPAEGLNHLPSKLNLPLNFQQETGDDEEQHRQQVLTALTGSRVSAVQNALKKKNPPPARVWKSCEDLVLALRTLLSGSEKPTIEIEHRGNGGEGDKTVFATIHPLPTSSTFDLAARHKARSPSEGNTGNCAGWGELQEVAEGLVIRVPAGLVWPAVATMNAIPSSEDVDESGGHFTLEYEDSSSGSRAHLRVQVVSKKKHSKKHHSGHKK